MAERRTRRVSQGQEALPFPSPTPHAPRPQAHERERPRASGTNDDRSRLLTIRQVCDRLQCGRTYTYALMQQGALRAVKLGRLTRIPLSELEEFVAHRIADAPYDVCERWSS